MKYIHTHLGLGDHFNTNGLIRHYCEIYDEVTTFAKHHYFEQVKFMYRDLPNLLVVSIGGDGQAQQYVIEKGGYPHDYIRVGHEKLSRDYKTFDESFYAGENLPFEYKWSKFFLSRDFEKETEVYNELNPENEPYIFCHSVDINRVRQDLKIINNDSRFLVTDFIKILENAEEVHVMQSSFKDLICCIKLDKPKCFLHNYVRGYDSWFNTVSINNVEVIY
jgi:hypothetical protein